MVRADALVADGRENAALPRDGKVRAATATCRKRTHDAVTGCPAAARSPAVPPGRIAF